jgi:hypothetical protein
VYMIVQPKEFFGSLNTNKVCKLMASKYFHDAFCIEDHSVLVSNTKKGLDRAFASCYIDSSYIWSANATKRESVLFPGRRNRTRSIHDPLVFRWRNMSSRRSSTPTTTVIIISSEAFGTSLLLRIVDRSPTTSTTPPPRPALSPAVFVYTCLRNAPYASASKSIPLATS